MKKRLEAPSFTEVRMSLTETKALAWEILINKVKIVEVDAVGSGDVFFHFMEKELDKLKHEVKVKPIHFHSNFRYENWW